MKPTTKQGFMKIAQAAGAAGVSVQTVEYYIMLGLVEPILQPPGRRRHFDLRLVRRIRLIHELNDSGYTLREIRQTWLNKR
jgi:DNA-binding transcriptional MerR regulator